MLGCADLSSIVVNFRRFRPIAANYDRRAISLASPPPRDPAFPMPVRCIVIAVGHASVLAPARPCIYSPVLVVVLSGQRVFRFDPHGVMDG